MSSPASGPASDRFGRVRGPMLALALLGSLVAGCDVDPPELDPDFDGGLGDEPVYADTLVAVADADGTDTCQPISGCPPSGPCADHPALGPPDGDAAMLPAEGRIEVAFLCDAILDQGGASPTPDFRLHGTVPEGAQAVVSVSLDGSSYRDIDFWTQGVEAFDLMRSDETTVVRFVRIAAQLGGGIQLDAVEALR